jgi:UDP-glucuronate decarboxylase
MTGDLENLVEAQRDPHFHLEIGDVREALHVYAEIIFNLACPASPVHCQSDPHATVTSSVLGALRLVEHARSRRCRIIHASTSEVYGDLMVHPQTEDYVGHVNPIGERSCYNEGKRVAETILMDARREHKIDARIVRIFNTYGPRMAFGDGRIVSNFLLQALQGQPITIYGNGEQTRSFCYVSDLLEGLVAAARVAEFDPPVNLGNPAEYSMLELAETAMKVVGRRVELVKNPRPQTIHAGGVQISRRRSACSAFSQRSPSSRASRRPARTFALGSRRAGAHSRPCDHRARGRSSRARIPTCGSFTQRSRCARAPVRCSVISASARFTCSVQVGDSERACENAASASSG